MRPGEQLTRRFSQREWTPHWGWVQSRQWARIHVSVFWSVNRSVNIRVRSPLRTKVRSKLDRGKRQA